MFNCLGGDAPLEGTKPGSQAHAYEGKDWYHNVYAGPFCKLHLHAWEYRNLVDHNRRYPDLAYEIPAEWTEAAKEVGLYVQTSSTT